MSMDFRKTTYRPSGVDAQFKTSYAMMSHWMTQVDGSTRKRRPSASFLMKGGGSSHFEKWGKKENSSPSALYVTGRMNQNLVRNTMAPVAAIDTTAPIHLRYSHNSGYDDFHKAFRTLGQQWPSKSYPTFGPPRLRHGRAGGSWRHVKEVQQAGGRRIVFVDGQTRVNDNSRITDVPSGHLIQPDAQDSSGPKHTLDRSSQGFPQCSRQLAKKMLSKGMTTYGSWDKTAVEHDNWNVMR
ncbi:hypothetical protein ScPMuIL_006811 [Solemya velum]